MGRLDVKVGRVVGEKGGAAYSFHDNWAVRLSIERADGAEFSTGNGAQAVKSRSEYIARPFWPGREVAAYSAGPRWSGYIQSGIHSPAILAGQKERRATKPHSSRF
jgi:hypothetical protein